MNGGMGHGSCDSACRIRITIDEHFRSVRRTSLKALSYLTYATVNDIVGRPTDEVLLVTRECWQE